MTTLVPKNKTPLQNETPIIHQRSDVNYNDRLTSIKHFETKDLRTSDKQSTEDTLKESNASNS